MEDQERVRQLLKKLKDYAAGFYYDSTRDGLGYMINNICSVAIKSKDYTTFQDDIANTLFEKVYIDGERWEPKLITGLVDIVLEIVDIQEGAVGFIPANKMMGDDSRNSQNMRDKIIERFNRNIDESNDEELMQYKIDIK